MHFKETEKVLTYIYKFFKGKCSDKKGQEGKVFPYFNKENWVSYFSIVFVLTGLIFQWQVLGFL